jgi:predicted acylesterase/phospholipase RssA
VKSTHSIVLAIVSMALVVSGCASAPERELSVDRSPYAVLVTGHDPLNPSEYMPQPKDEAVYTSEEDLIRYYERVRGHALNIVKLSGGGQNGAFGAGFLKGWTKSGTRPEFDIVTGVSTGALLATHAFLGTPADDAVLEELFTTITAEDIYGKRNVLSLVGGADSLLKTDRLRALVEKTITAEVLERVAAEQNKGRRLLVGTTNLDYNQTWAWNLGLIAKQGTPEALERYRDVLMASSAFPIMFPPVEIDGHLFADGAVRANLLVMGLSGRNPPGPPLYGPGTVYVIQNGRLKQPPEPVKDSIGGLASKSIGEMMGSSMQGLLIRSYFAAAVHEYEFRTVEVPAGVDIGSNPLAFDQKQMRAGFDAGYKLAQQPNPWADEPPLIGDFPDWALDLIKEGL